MATSLYCHHHGGWPDSRSKDTRDYISWVKSSICCGYPMWQLFLDTITKYCSGTIMARAAVAWKSLILTSYRLSIQSTKYDIRGLFWPPIFILQVCINFFYLWMVQVNLSWISPYFFVVSSSAPFSKMLTPLLISLLLFLDLPSELTQFPHTSTA